MLVLSGTPSARSALIDFAHHITKNNSLFICGHIIEVSIFLIKIIMHSLYNNTFKLLYFRHQYHIRREIP